MTYFLCFIGILVFLCWFVLMRNFAILKVRLAFIDDKELWPKTYYSLPSYEAMVFNPVHWGRWTKAQWVRWVK